MTSAWLFNLGADVYAWFTGNSTWRASCARMAERLAPCDPRLVLHLGCGPGVSALALAKTLANARVVGLDAAPRMLAQARRRDPDRTVTWLRADAAHLPFRRGRVDACTGHSVLYLMPDRAAVLAEVRRVLRPGGRLVLMEPSARAATLEQVLKLSTDPRHLVSVSLWRPFSRLHGRFTEQSLVDTLERSGFFVCAVEPTLGGLGLLATAAAC